MINKPLTKQDLIPEKFAQFVLDLEQENLQKLEKEDKKFTVAKIIRSYEEVKKGDN